MPMGRPDSEQEVDEEVRDLVEAKLRALEPDCARCGHKKRCHIRWVWKDDSGRAYTGHSGLNMNCVVVMRQREDQTFEKCPCPVFIAPEEGPTPEDAKPAWMQVRPPDEDPEPGDRGEAEECAGDPLARIEEGDE